MDDRDRIKMLAWIRIGIGAALFVAPRLSARIWAGDEEPSAATPIAMRGLGARDAALGIGLLNALDRGTPVRGWLEASALADASDAASTLFSGIPMWRRLLWAGFAASGVYVAAQLAPIADD